MIGSSHDSKFPFSPGNRGSTPSEMACRLPRVSLWLDKTWHTRFHRNDPKKIAEKTTLRKPEYF